MATIANVSPELLAEAVRTIFDLKQKAREAAALVGPAVKRFADRGVNKKALMRALKDRLRDDEEVLAENREYIRIMALEQHRVLEQDLFGDLDLSPLGRKATEEHLIWSAEQAGYAAGKEGGDDDSAKRYPPGSPAQAAWARGHKRGAAVREAEQDDETEVADVRKSRDEPAKAPVAAAVPEPAVAAEPADIDARTGTADDDGLFGDPPPPFAAEPKLPRRSAKPVKAPISKAPAPAEAPKRARGRPPGKGKIASATTRH